MEKRIITISREFGSGGRTIGKLVAEHRKPCISFACRAVRFDSARPYVQPAAKQKPQRIFIR